MYYFTENNWTVSMFWIVEYSYTEMYCFLTKLVVIINSSDVYTEDYIL